MRQAWALRGALRARQPQHARAPCVFHAALLIAAVTRRLTKNRPSGQRCVSVTVRNCCTYGPMFAELEIGVQRRWGVFTLARSTQRLQQFALFADRPTTTTGKRNHER